ncbi:MAG: AAA family ATPase [Nitrospinae bacterium]|nr:AAA family ATPase [Nitrospinota bacterium]
MPITSVKFRNFKALQNYSVTMRRMNILVGPNNSGKSTVLSAFRLLEQALKTGRARRPSQVQTHFEHSSNGHVISENTVPFSLENVHFNYDTSDSHIEFQYSKGNKLFFYFPTEGGVTMYWETEGRPVFTTSAFRSAFPDEVQVIPVLGPIEQEEEIVTDETLRRATGTPRASRHFRNYWRKNPKGFNEFQKMVEKTWPGMSIKKPELAAIMDRRLTMFVSENRIDRELYWSGLGFQVWCQLLTHISRCSSSDLLVVDEPEVYLHPEIQRQLLGILRDLKPNILLATHSVEILSEADPSEILLVNKSSRSAQRLRDIEGVQQAIDEIGSIQNVTLTELARNRRILFVEGFDDYKIIRRFAKLLGFDDLAAGSGLTALESGGFDSWHWVQALALGFKKTLGSDLKIAAIYDPDYRCYEESKQIKEKLEQEIEFAHFHHRKEIENYLLSPNALERALKREIGERSRQRGEKPKLDFNIHDILELETQSLKSKCSSRYISNYLRFFKGSSKDDTTLISEAQGIFEDKWSELESRLEIVPGKAVLKAVREQIENDYGVTLTDFRIIDAYTKAEVPQDLAKLICQLDEYRNKTEIS